MVVKVINGIVSLTLPNLPAYTLFAHKVGSSFVPATYHGLSTAERQAVDLNGTFDTKWVVVQHGTSYYVGYRTNAPKPMDPQDRLYEIGGRYYSWEHMMST